MRLFIICSLIVFVIGKNYRKSTDNCKLQDDPKFPQCKAKISWMQGNWQSDPFYKNNGVDGSLCSIINYLSKVEKFCPCAVPIDSRYPECANKVSWMLGNWQSNPFYKNNGVDGSVCSIITYLSKVEKFCPCTVPINSQFPFCQDKVSWMLGNWQSNPFYKNNGVDGSVCSIVTYLSKVEKFCPCTVPINSQFPFCQNKVSWMQGNWKSNPFYKDNGVDGSLCSILIYLSKVEKWCPL
nr:alpha-1,6-mannosylglycoprotein 6-beta-N-acetylglucosaminyltransferase A-like isoform X3 [Hydra vulgaris]